MQGGGHSFHILPQKTVYILIYIFNSSKTSGTLHLYELCMLHKSLEALCSYVHHHHQSNIFFNKVNFVFECWKKWEFGFPLKRNVLLVSSLRLLLSFSIIETAIYKKISSCEPLILGPSVSKHQIYFFFRFIHQNKCCKTAGSIQFTKT